MKYDLVIKNGTLVTAASVYRADIAVHQGRIAAIGADLSAEEVIDATGLLVVPGAVDIHVHMHVDVHRT
ncbi:MAG: hypothetical protein D6775_03630, partial [Caldilineae bacterium]